MVKKYHSSVKWQKLQFHKSYFVHGGFIFAGRIYFCREDLFLHEGLWYSLMLLTNYSKSLFLNVLQAYSLAKIQNDSLKCFLCSLYPCVMRGDILRSFFKNSTSSSFRFKNTVALSFRKNWKCFTLFQIAVIFCFYFAICKLRKKRVMN